MVTVAPDTLHHGESDSELRSSRGSDPAEIEWRQGRFQTSTFDVADILVIMVKFRTQTEHHCPHQSILLEE